MAESQDTREEIILDAEAKFLLSGKETGNEWEIFKENARPLKRGRNVERLNKSLKFHSQHQSKASLYQTRRKLIEAIDSYQGDDPLYPWLECIKWSQEAFPCGGDSSSLLTMYEQCVRSFWHSEQYKNDLRYLKVWLEYADNCNDAQVIYKFLEVNNIGTSHAIFYIAYASHLELKFKMKSANDIFYLGLSRKAEPIKKLQESYKKFLNRSTKRDNFSEMDDPEDSQMPSRCFGTVLTAADNKMANAESSSRLNTKPNSDKNALFSIYKETNTTKHNSENKKSDTIQWKTIASAAERNKENNAISSKWTEHKLPPRTISRASRADTITPCLNIFVDEDCDTKKPRNEGENHKKLKARHSDRLDKKTDLENLRANPLRNFPLTALPR